MTSKRNRPLPERTIALCYIRQSRTRDENDTNSPERQRANIEEVCKRNGWLAEWYEDVGGHKSGRSESSRPQWLALKERLDDPDVVALVANDLSRLHRKGWRIGDLLEQLTELDVHLVLAAPGREVDTTTVKGRMFLQFGAIIDEYYAEDISQRSKDMVAHRKRQGKSIGKPPFGTIRNEEGYLTASLQGAWLLPDGRFEAGEPDQSPIEGAMWRSYYEAAKLILELYAAGKLGAEKIAYELNTKGWPFCDRYGNPRTVCRDDVRRVLANWPEYGGLVLDKKAKDRPAYEEMDIDSIPFRQDRAVFPLDLLRQVARIRQERSRRPIDTGVKREVFPYALTGITYCYHCTQMAQEQDNPALLTTLGAYTTRHGERRYRHKRGVKCGCTNRSVPCDIYEEDFGRLVSLLTFDRDRIDTMTDMAIQFDKELGISADDVDFEDKKQEAIALCRRRIDAAVHLYGDGRITREEYLRRTEANEREIVQWESRTTETEKLGVELGMCIEAVERVTYLWENGNPEDRQGVARMLFRSLTYDLDTRRIVHFQLKPWAERYLVLRERLYQEELGEEIATQVGSTGVPHTGFEPVFQP